MKKNICYKIILLKGLFLLTMGVSLMPEYSSAQQVQIILNPFNGYSFNIDQVGQTTLINGSQKHYKVSLTYDVKLSSGELVCEMATSQFDLSPGTQQLTNEAGIRTHVSFGNNTAAMALSATNLLPTGRYTFEATLYDVASNTILALYDEEREYQINNFPPHLHYPYDADSILTLSPDLEWIPPAPTTNEMEYELQLVENKSGENAYNAILHNIPLVDAKNLNDNRLAYPPNAPPLEYGHTYTWEVYAYIGNQEIGKTEVWQFTPVRYKSGSTKKPQKTIIHPYWILSAKQDGGYYDAYGKVRISFVNKTADTVFHYQIIDMAKPNKKIENLPAVKIRRGQNKVDIGVNGNPEFIDNKQYVLSVKLSDGSAYVVRFKYHHDD